MAGNLSGLHVFNADVSPEPLSLLDGNFNPIVTALNSLNNYSNYYADSGALNALAITVPGTQSVGYSAGLMLQVKANNTTTSTTPTLQVNALGTVTIVNFDGSALAIGAIAAGAFYSFIHDGTNFRLQNQGATGTGSFTATLSGGFTANPTGPMLYSVAYGVVALYLQASILGTSNAATDIVVTGLPTACIPVHTKTVLCAGLYVGGGSYWGTCAVDFVGNITVRVATTQTGVNGSGTPLISAIAASWSTSGQKGLVNGWTITYGLL
jgi:hypothetical protein